MTSTRNSCLAAGALTLTWLLGPGGAPAQAVPSTWQKPIQVATTGAAAKPAPASPVVSLTLTPNQIVLDGPRSLHRILVTGVRRDGTLVDLTSQAKFSSANPRIAAVSSEGIATPAGDGQSKILVQAAGRRAQATLTVKEFGKAQPRSFSNHVISVLSKAGCSMGACHGAAAGKNGFRLTLRGYDPDLDYERLLREGGARRLSKSDPGKSLLLMKGTLAVPHAGGQRFKTDSLEYQVIADWMAEGLKGPASDDPTLVKLEVAPGERILADKSEQQLLVRGHFSNGKVEDVTHWARYSSNEEGVATVDDTGKLRIQGSGETAITIMYLDKVTFARVSVPFPNKVAAAQYAKFAPRSYVDRLVVQKLQHLRLLPSDVAPDEEFFRRVYLDCIGTLPSATEVREFLQDKDPFKRSRLVDRLLERPEYVDYWTYKWGDLLRVNRETLTEKGMWAFNSWVRQAVAENRPWDKVVYEVLTANGSTFTDGPANFYRISRTPEDLTETVSQAFLGIRVQCARCHNHPFEKWTQADYYKFANLLSRVNRKAGDHPQDQYISAAASGEIAFPKTGKPLAPAPYDGQPMAADSQQDRRVYLAEWLASGKNSYFVQSIVNRVWRHYMGRGLIEPVDDLRATNPASNEPLMQALCQDLVEHNFDLKHLMRQIMNSRAYQLTSRPLPENKKDDKQYSRYFVRRLTAEQLLDAISQVTQQPEKFSNLPAGYRAIQLPDTKVQNYFLDVFGRPPRQITCDCERAQEPNMAQALHLINGQGVNQKISANGGFVDQLLKTKKQDNEIVEEMYLTCFGRFPTRAEMDAAIQTIKDAMVPPKVEAKPAEQKPAEQKPADPKAAKPAEPPKFDPAVARRQVFEDLLWALINGKEFVFNH